MSVFAALWARIAAAGAILAAVAVFLVRVLKAGGDAARLKSTRAALDHQTETVNQVRQSDDAIGDPSAPRARRVRRLFERKE